MKKLSLKSIILLFFVPLSIGAKGVSVEATAFPEIDYIVDGIVLTNSGTPKSGAFVSLDATTPDSSFISHFIQFKVVQTGDSGVFHFRLNNMISNETGVRTVVFDGLDTIRGPWRFTFSAKQQETLGTFTSHDCSSRKTVGPTNEVFTFDPDTVVVR
jgi:hypothetical protein